MEKVAKFYKVSQGQFMDAFANQYDARSQVVFDRIYDDIKMPTFLLLGLRRRFL